MQISVAVVSSQSKLLSFLQITSSVSFFETLLTVSSVGLCVGLIKDSPTIFVTLRLGLYLILLLDQRHMVLGTW